MENNYWYVGQKVSDQRFGNGEIVAINVHKDYYPIVVDFGICKQHYYIDGKYVIHDAFPSLSLNPHVPLEYNKIFKKGDIVWYLYQNIWYLGIYDCIEEGSHKVSEGFSSKDLTDVITYHYIDDEDIKLYSPNIIKE